MDESDIGIKSERWTEIVIEIEIEADRDTDTDENQRNHHQPGDSIQHKPMSRSLAFFSFGRVGIFRTATEGFAAAEETFSGPRQKAAGRS